MADDEQFSLCWNNFNTNLSAGFHESLCRGDLVDVTLAAEGQMVKAHRLVLSVCSPYFRKMFTQMPANQHAFVFLKDVSHSALKDLIQFMYCGEVNVKQEALPAFISTAEALQIKGLTDSDPPSAQSPPEPTTPTTQQIQQITSPRVQQRQRTSTSRSYKIETVDDSIEESKPPPTQIVIQTTAPPTANTIVHHQPHLQQQQPQPQIQTISSGGSTVTTASTTLVQTNKRTAQRSGIGNNAPHIKRTKSTIDPLDTTETSTTNAANTQQIQQQLQPQQISVQTSVVSSDSSKIQQVRQQAATSAIETEFIDLPTIELPTKSEPEFTEDAGEVVTGDQDTSYVEDDTYGDMRYDESYFTENEDGTPAVSAANAAGVVTASTSKATAKQQGGQSFSDSSYVDPSEQGNSEAQELLRAVPRKRGRPKRDGKADVPQIKLIDKLIEAIKTGASQPAVYASTTKGGMKLVYDGHHFKFSFRKGQFSVFQCCYKENREECKVRVVCDQKRVYPLDGEHVHFVQATDKSVTSEQFMPGDNDNEMIVGDDTDNANTGGETLFVLEDANATEHVIVAESVTKEEPDFDASIESNITLENLQDTTDGAGASTDVADANDFREKIKRRLQKALQNKKK